MPTRRSERARPRIVERTRCRYGARAHVTSLLGVCIGSATLTLRNRGGRLELQEPHHHDLFGRDCGWRLRFLFPAASAPSRQAPAGQSDRCGQEHARRWRGRARRRSTGPRRPRRTEPGGLSTARRSRHFLRGHRSILIREVRLAGKMEQFTPIVVQTGIRCRRSADDLMTTPMNVGTAGW